MWGMLVVAAGSSTAQAKTPDMQTPSMETVCDLYSGAAFGVCNAYCEAMDCHLDEPRASERACTRKRDRFVELTGHAPPCELACPCSAIDAFAGFVAGEPAANACIAPDEDQLRVEARLSPFEFAGVFVNASEVALVCGYYDSSGTLESLEVSDGEFDICLAIVDDMIQQNDLVCDDLPPPPPPPPPT